MESLQVGLSKPPHLTCSCLELGPTTFEVALPRWPLLLLVAAVKLLPSRLKAASDGRSMRAS